MTAAATLGRRLAAFGLGTTALLPIATLAIVMLMVVPVPALILDMFFIFNIALSLAVLMVALKSDRPLDFSTFPTVLLFATMLRLALNVASTRAVLVNGHTGTAAAGHVVEAFGKFLIGGDFAVGLFVFIIVTIINLIVITKGAGRVSEVSARFTLDALPGKQMAIDAELSAGALTPEEAKSRRQEIGLEADFYGSMDGASKFTKGDAVAGVLILGVNLIGGLVLGMVSHDLPFGEAARLYVTLAIGDGLVAQVPALLLSLAAAVIVTRVSSAADLSLQVLRQFRQPGVWAAVAAILALLAMLPGMPHLLALSAAGGAAFAAWRLARAERIAAGDAEDLAPRAGRAVPMGAEEDAAESGVGWEEVSDHTLVGIELGFGLIELIDEARRAPLLQRASGVRRQLSRELGFVLPPIRIRDNLDLAATTYRILVGGVPVAEDEVRAGEWLALESGPLVDDVPGHAVRDPSFGLPARWVPEERRDRAIAAGYTVVDAATVIGTHLSQVLQAHAHRLLGQDDVQRLLDNLAPGARQLVSGLVPKLVPLATFTGALKHLIEEGVPIREFRRVVEAATAGAAHAADPADLAEVMRPALADLVVARLVGVRDTLPVLTLGDGLERLVIASVRADPASPYPIEPTLARRIAEAAAGAAAPLTAAGAGFAVVADPLIRRPLARLLRARLPGVPVLSFLELPETRDVRVAGSIGGAEDLPDATPAALTLR